MHIVGTGFLAKHLTDTFADRYPDVVALAAGVSSTSSATPPAAFDREANLVYRTLQECREKGRTLLFFSTASFAMYGITHTPVPEDGPLTPQNVYGRHKLALETTVRSAGVPYLILRLAHMVGGDQPPHHLLPTFVRQLLSGTITVHRNAFRDLFDIADLMRAIEEMLAAGVRDVVVNVASGFPVPITRLVDEIEERLGVEAERDYIEGTSARTVVSTERLRALAPGVDLHDLKSKSSRSAYLNRLLDNYVAGYVAAAEASERAA
jgi:nucleoside-diphosphate-sugar epimerase